MFMSLKKADKGAFLKTPFYPYVRPKENQQIHVTMLVECNGGRRNRITNKAQIRRFLTNLRFLVPELEEILRESISTVPENKATLEKWIQTAAALSGKVRELRRALFFNRAIDIANAREIATDINNKIYLLRQRVGILRHRMLLKTASSPLLTMIEDFQLDFPDSLPLKFGGESTLQRLLGVKIYLRCNFCMKKLCLENISAVVSYVDGHGHGSQPISRTKFYVSGKAPNNLSLSPGKMLSLPEGQPINMILGRDSEHLSVKFGAWIQLLGLSQSANGTLDKDQVSVNFKGNIFEKFPTELSVVAKIKESKNWNSLLYLVKGKMVRLSLLPNMLQNAITNYTLTLTQNAQRRIQRAQAANDAATRKTKDGELLLKKKKNTFTNASKILEDKLNNLFQKRIDYARGDKIQFRKTLFSYLHSKNQTVCEMKNCTNIDLVNTCIPDVCRKEVKTKYTVPDCKKVTKKIKVVRVKKVPNKKCFEYTTPTVYKKTAGNWWWKHDTIQKTGGGKKKKECFNYDTHESVTERKDVNTFECTNKEKEIVSNHKFPYECCLKETIQILNPQCVRQNSDCWKNRTEIEQQLTQQQNNDSALVRYFNGMTEAGRQVNFAQMEVNIARTRVRLASNQVKLARAFLQQQQYSEESINISKIEEQEQLGIRLADQIKSLDGRELISVESLSFSTSMTSTTKTLLPFVASVKDVDGNNKFIEFPIEFKKLNYSLASASKQVIQTLFGKSNSRKRRSAYGDFAEGKLGMDNGQHMCFFSHQANSFFADVIDSLEFLLESTNAYFEAISSGIEQVDSHIKHSVKQSFSRAPQLQTSFSEMMQSIKDNYIDITSTTSWETILEQWRVHLNVLTADKNFTECSGIEDCLEYFFRNLHEFYQFEYGNRALEIKQQLQEMRMVFISLLQRNYSFVAIKEIATIAKALLNKTEDESVLCGTSPVIVKSSPAEVVVLNGDTVNLTCLVGNSNQVEIVWIKNERVLEDKHDEVLILKNANRKTQGAYKCKVSNSRGGTVSNVTIVTVHEVPRITSHPTDVHVLIGTEILPMVCISDGIPRPTTEWFFMPSIGKVVRLNSSDQLLLKKNLTSQDSGFYYCNVSNIRGTIRSRMARLDVLAFSPGKPRITVFLKFSRCAFDNSPGNSSNCTDGNYMPVLQLDYASVHSFFSEITAKMGWSWKQVERLDFSPQSDVSLSFVITANESNLISYTSSGLMDALNSFSVSRSKLTRDLLSLRSALEERKINFLKKNALFVPKNGGFTAKLVTQECPEGKEADKNGFLCGGYSWFI